MGGEGAGEMIFPNFIEDEELACGRAGSQRAAVRMTFEAPPHFWTRAIKGLAARINRVSWLERFAPVAFVAAAVAAIAIYGLRRSGAGAEWGWRMCGAGLTAVGAVTWWQTRRERFSRDDARVLLEYRLGLDSRLTAAELGLTAWPRQMPVPKDVVRWRSRTVQGWLAAALAMVMAGAWLPVPSAEERLARPHEKPPALVQTEAWLEALAQLEAVDPKSVEPLAERAQELARESPENQYTHSGLEAADALREQTSAAMQGLANALETAAGVMAPLEQPGAGLTADQLKNIGERLEAALRAAEGGTLALRPELLQACEACAGDPKSLTAAQAAQLRAGLAKAGKQIRGVGGAALAGVVIAEAGPGAEAGRGGINRGPGEAPLTFSDKASDAPPGRIEAVASEDMSRASLGDLLGTQTGEHEIDPASAQGLTAAGAPAAAGAGGEAVWVNRLTPSERAALTSFFK